MVSPEWWELPDAVRALNAFRYLISHSNNRTESQVLAVIDARPQSAEAESHFRALCRITSVFQFWAM